MLRAGSVQLARPLPRWHRAGGGMHRCTTCVAPRGDELVERDHDLGALRDWLREAMQILNERERFIVRERKLRDAPRTLESLGQELSLSKERVRQLESAAFQKMRKHLERHGGEVQSLLA